MGLINYHTKCRVCGHETLAPIFNLGEHYLHGLFVYPDFKPPIGKVPTNLVRCENKSGGCGLVQLSNSVDSDVLYSRYGYRSSTNETMRKHLSTIVDDVLTLKSQYHSPDSSRQSILDIGCNDGYLLKQIPREYRKYGIDPCDVGNTITGLENFTFINDIYPSVKLERITFDIITMVACFYDLDNPVMVAKELRRSLKGDGLLIVEVSYWPDKMAQNAIDEVCHEHVCFYNYQNLEFIFAKAGLKVVNVKKNTINGSSIQLWLTPQANDCYDNDVFKKNILNIKFEEFNLRLDSSTEYTKFVGRIIHNKLDIERLFQSIREERKTVHLYGASTKGNVLLQFLGLDNSNIQYAAERSPAKYGGTTLGTNIEMISEQDSRAKKPDYYFVPIWSFKDEIIKREADYLASGGKLIFPLPNLEIVGN